MKKIMTYVGVSSMVLVLGLGPGFAQQSAQKDTSPAPAVVTQTRPATQPEAGKEKGLPTKPEVGTKAEKGVPDAPAGVKAPEKAAATKAVVDSKSEKAAAAGKDAGTAVTTRPNLDVKPDKVASPQGSVSQPAVKTEAAKSALDAQSDKTAAQKAAPEKAPAAVEGSKSPAKQ